MARISSREMLWNKISRTCFQDRVMPYAYWISAITDSNHREHHKVLNQSAAMIPARQFVDLMGERAFIDTWKLRRQEMNLDRISVNQSKIILDCLWSILVTGFSFSNINTSVTKPLNKQLMKTYLDICKRNKKSIYQVAKDTGRAYNRVHADVEKLERVGLISSFTTEQKGRRVRFLSALTTY